ncbi:hypothetical protein HMN09_00666600 [Mycena chlorophos]|uniref:Uncharacterized protein n=1 Tax=Mycena chlorophos TaxID=658473 RepID=A0A8H6SY84_MYCCL|nr:hypothetical protein HMN09_00666600 [Mycena chlorophos]
MKEEYEQTPDPRIKGAIVDIYTQLCGDAVLRNRLFQLGFLGQLLSLLEDPHGRNLALDSLVALTHHGGIEVRAEVAKATCEPLLRLLRDLPDDPHVPQLAIRVLAHTIAGAVSNEAKQQDPKLASTLPLASVAQAFVDALRRPNATGEMVTHVTTCLVELSEDIQLTKSMVELLVAGLRYNRWFDRTRCLSGLLIHVIPQAAFDLRTMDPTKVVQCIAGIAHAPACVRETMHAWGLQRTGSYRMVASNREFAAALGAGYASGGGMYEAGKKIAELIVGTENAFFDGFFPVKNPANAQMMLPGGGSSPSSSVQFWSDTLPICARAIREKQIASETHLADILELKFLLMRQRYPDAVDLAQRALRRNPDFAYPYYIMMLALDDEPALRAAKRGIQFLASRVGAFVRFGLSKG